METADQPGDPIIEKRRRIRAWAGSAQRFGYALLGVATIVFFVGVFGSFSDGIVTGVLVPLVAGCAVLAVSIQVGYAIRGAERHEEESNRQRGR